jgi:predicted nucleotidyltransferase
VRQSGSALGAVQRELRELTDAGLLIRTVEGRQVYFQANRSSPLFAELQSLLVKTAGLADVIRDALGPIAERIVAAVVFGSAARGQLGTDSDIDLLVVGDVSFVDVSSALAEAQVRLGRDVNPSVYPPSEFQKKLRDGHHFLTNILSEPRLFVVGGPDELVRLGAERLAGRAPNQRQRNPRPARGRGARPRGQRR